MFEKHGLYGIDYAADDAIYEQYQQEADVIFLQDFHCLLQAGRDVMLDRSFWAKLDRDAFKAMVERARARYVLVYLHAPDKEALWQRICDRAATTKDANSAFVISREIFERYWNGFERPEGEGELTIDISEGVVASLV